MTISIPKWVYYLHGGSGWWLVLLTGFKPAWGRQPSPVGSIPTRSRQTVSNLIMRYLALDPGSHKVGVAVANVQDGEVEPLWLKVLPVEDLQKALTGLIEQYQPEKCLIGGGTGYRRLLTLLDNWFPELEWECVDEQNSTLQARQLYFQYHPPRGLSRWVPRGLLLPPAPYDDYVALLLIMRHALEDRK
jgi:RNase H-fold protein (predicted Holliday junction resolvase)